ncbi:hypothetical protein NQ315_004826 [Exocentrus adspersus]|uniref:Uncharacterized protein n=1 Tax=Exocentrus adspersus TaxID=1586481 RepID=A0AAV8W1Z8_9CUCU|nr:hypothetical protein NQ315_004826 [Exocentrus adspersus]
MEESFELLSSMSPKVKHCQKHFRKGTTVLALRRSLQRSSLCNRSITKNEDLVITEISSSSTSGSSSRSANSNDKRILNESPIIVSDSDTDLDELKLISKKAVRTKHSVKHKDEGNYILSEDKLENIKHWIDNVNHQTNFTNNSIHSVYTELSSVDATEDCTDFVSERTGRAINSTAVQLPSPRFDQLFKRKSNQISLDSKICINDDACDSIEESYVESKTSLNKKLQFDEMLKDDIVLNRHSFIALNETKNRELCQPHLLSDNLNVLNKLNESNTDNASIGKDCDSSFYSLDESLRTRLKNKESGKNVATNNKKTYTPNSAVNSGYFNRIW